MSGWGQYPNSAYQQGGSQQTYSAQGQQQVDGYGNYGQGTGYGSGQAAAPMQDSSYGQAGYGAGQQTMATGAAQPAYGAQQQASYGYTQQGGQGGAVAQAAQGLAPDQQARVSQIVAQIGSGGQQGYGPASYQGTPQTSLGTQYGAGASQAAYGAAQPAAQTYTQNQSASYAPQQSPAQGYGTALQTPQQGYSSSAYGAPQQASAAYTQQPQQASNAYNPQQQASAYSTQAGYQAPQGTPSGTYGVQQSATQYGAQASATPQGYASQTSQAPYATATAYGQQASRTSAQQPGAMQQAAYGQQAASATSYQAPYGTQYGATQYTGQQAAAPAPKPITLPARPQQATQASTYGSAAYTRTSNQARPAAIPAAASAYGKPTVQAPAGSRSNITTRPTTQLPVAKPGVPAAPAGGAPASRLPNSRDAGARLARPAAVGQSAREIARVADAMRDKKDEARGRERARNADKDSAKESGKERPTAVAVTAPASRERERERDREPLRLKKPAPLPKASPPPRRREPDNSVRLSIRLVTVVDRDYNDVIERYPRLYVSADFAKSVSSWIQAEGFGKEKTLWPLHEPVKFQHEVDFELSSAPAWVLDKAPSSGIKWTARVVLLQGLDEAAAKECAKGTHHGGQHLHHLLKFLTLRHEVDNPAKGRAERSGIMAVGGSYDPALDGPLVDSSRTPKALINTCIRHARNNLGIDLSPCTQWMRFLEVHYQRPSASTKPPAMESAEVTVVFMANVRTMFDKDWTSTWEEQEAWLKRKKEHEDAVEAKKAKEAEELKAEEEKAKEEKVKKDGGAEESAASKDAPDVPKEEVPAKAENEVAGDEPAAKRPKTEPSEEIVKPDSTTSEAKPMEDTPTEDPVKKADAAKEENETEKKEEVMPEIPRLLMRGKRSAMDRWRSASVSLDGLLDYDEEDRDEPTLELSLFAEAFQEMLARDFGNQILKALYTERDAALRRREERKRKREEEEKALAEKAAAKKAAAEKGAAEKAAAEKVAAEKAAAEKAKAEKEAPVKEEAAAEATDKEASGAKQDSAPSQVKEEASKEAAGGAAPSIAAASIPNGDKADDEGPKVKAEPGDENGKVAASAEGPIAMEVDSAAGKPQAVNGAATEQDGGKHEAAKPEPAASEAVNGDAAPDKASKPAGGEAGKDGKSEKEKTKEKEKPKKKYKVNEELLQAFRYFDRNCTGYLRVDDLRRIINNLGLGLSLRTVKELCLNVAGGSSSARTRADRVYYRDITDKEIT